MASIVQSIQDIRSVRKDLRDIKLSANILTSIESIHNCIKNGADSSGWKKVEWRNGNSNGRPAYNQGNKPSKSNKSGSFGNRPPQTRDTGFTFDKNKNRPESQISIPLTGNSSSITSIVNTPIPTDGFRNHPTKYVSKFKKPATNVEDTILNTILLGKLNKFSPQNYGDIKEFITHIIDNGETDMIKCFMKLVFEKAASEEIFCPLYAKLLSELSISYPILLIEMGNLYSQYMEIFDEVSEVSEGENYNEFCKRNIGNKYRRGYSQFLAELIKHDVIEVDIFIKTINKIIGKIEQNHNNAEFSKLNEEYADCLMKIIKAIESGVAGKIKQIRNLLKNDMKRIQPLTVRGTENSGMSNKSRFTMLDIYEGIKLF